MKKLILAVLLTIPFVFGFADDSFASGSYTNISQLGNQKHFMMKNGAYTYLYVLTNNNGKFYLKGTFENDSIAATVDYEYYQVDTKTGDLEFLKYIEANRSHNPITMWDYDSLQGNTSIYSDNTFTSFFFNAPEIPIAARGYPEIIPETMGKTLVDGGVLSMGLIVLAILLGILLVRRFPFWFLR